MSAPPLSAIWTWEADSGASAVVKSKVEESVALTLTRLERLLAEGSPLPTPMLFRNKLSGDSLAMSTAATAEPKSMAGLPEISGDPSPVAEKTTLPETVGWML